MFAGDEIYHIGKQLSIWLRRRFLKGVTRPKWIVVDAPIDDILGENKFWESVYYELWTHGHVHRDQPGNRIAYDKLRMEGQRPHIDVQSNMGHSPCD